MMGLDWKKLNPIIRSAAAAFFEAIEPLENWSAEEKLSIALNGAALVVGKTLAAFDFTSHGEHLPLTEEHAYDKVMEEFRADVLSIMRKARAVTGSDSTPH